MPFTNKRKVIQVGTGTSPSWDTRDWHMVLSKQTLLFLYNNAEFEIITIHPGECNWQLNSMGLKGKV